jgi:2-dehydro-3-deoxy-D-gluconate 5-dehydrogenase
MQVLQVNLNAVFTLCRDAGAYMLSRPARGSPAHRGSIINIASLVSFQGGLNVPAYAAAKGGVAQLTKSLSNQWAADGINVNAVRCSVFDRYSDWANRRCRLLQAIFLPT